MKEGTLPSREVELKLIETLRTITEGKIYVEVERARLTHRLASMQEQDGDLNTAAKTMQELQVRSTVDKYTLPTDKTDRVGFEVGKILNH